MNKLIVSVATAVMLTSVVVSGFAATSSYEGKCKAQAEKHKISADKLDAYVKTCVDKHMKHMKHVKHVKKDAPQAATPAVAPTPAAPASTPASDPAM